MKIISAGFEILDTLNGVEILKKIEKVARVCYKSEDKITELLSSVIIMRCWSILAFLLSLL